MVPTLIFLFIIYMIKSHLDEHFADRYEEEQLEKLITLLLSTAVFFTIPIFVELRQFLKFHKRKRAILLMVERHDFNVILMNEQRRGWPVREILRRYAPDVAAEYAQYSQRHASTQKERLV